MMSISFDGSVGQHANRASLRFARRFNGALNVELFETIGAAVSHR